MARDGEEMARYVTTLRTDRSPRDVFTYMADLRNFAEWDPGVVKVQQVEGDGGGAGAVFDVSVKGPGRTIDLRYVTTTYEPSKNLLVVARSSMFTSTDRVTVVADGSGSIVTYDADLQFNGALKLFDPLLKLSFGKIGDRAAAGLRRVLDGTPVA